MIYAGGYLLFFGIKSAVSYSAVPKSFDFLTPESCSEGLIVEGEIYQTVGELYGVGEYVRPNFLGIPIGEKIRHRFFVIPMGLEEDLYFQRYMLVCVSDEEDIEALSALERWRPGERGPDDPAIHFRGTLSENDRNKRMALVQFLMNNPGALFGAEWGMKFGEAMFQNRVVPYTIYVDNRESADYSPIIIGGVLCAVGITLSVILILRIKGEREGY